MNRSGTTNRWERHKKRTRRHLLQVADRLFREQGFEATTVEEVAHAADVAKGTFFNYFETKESLLLHLLAQQIDEALTTLPGEGEPAPTRLRLTLKTAWDALAPYRHLMRHAILQNVRPPKEPAATKTQRMKNALIHLLRQGQEEGTIRQDINVEIAALFLSVHFLRLCTAACHGEDDGRDWESRLDDGLSILYHGLLTAPRP
jgi:AcrR family transcriptional regulator